MNFSLLCPTRNRILQVESLLSSLKMTVFDFSNVEVLFGCDEDDPETEKSLVAFRDKYKPVLIRIHKRKRSDFINGDYYNWLASFSVGKFLCVIGDDCVYTKKYWDELAIKKLESYCAANRDRVVYGAINDGTPPPPGSLKQFCCFPLISREAYQTLGFVLHGEIPTWGADSSLYEVYADKKVDRILQLPEIEIKHVCHHSVPGFKRDNVSYNVEKIFKTYQSGQIIGRVARLIIPQNISLLDMYIKKTHVGIEQGIFSDRMV